MSTTATAVAAPIPPSPAFLERLFALAAARNTFQQARDEKARRLAQFELENRPFLELYKEAEARVEAEEVAVRALAKQTYLDTGEKRPAPGVSVEEHHVYDYNEKDALEFAERAQIPGLIVPAKLDARAFGKLAAVGELPFVRMSIEPVVKLATNLDEKLAELSAGGAPSVAHDFEER